MDFKIEFSKKYILVCIVAGLLATVLFTPLFRSNNIYINQDKYIVNTNYKDGNLNIFPKYDNFYTSQFILSPTNILKKESINNEKFYLQKNGEEEGAVYMAYLEGDRTVVLKKSDNPNYTFNYTISLKDRMLDYLNILNRNIDRDIVCVGAECPNNNPLNNKVNLGNDLTYEVNGNNIQQSMFLSIPIPLGFLSEGEDLCKVVKIESGGSALNFNPDNYKENKKLNNFIKQCRPNKMINHNKIILTNKYGKNLTISTSATYLIQSPNNIYVPLENINNQIKFIFD